MKIIFSIIIMIITIILYTSIFSIIILSTFFGIPQTLKLKRKNILTKNASIKPYLITIIFWLTIIFFSLIILHNVLEKTYFDDVISGMDIAFIISLMSLSKKNYKNNMEELLKMHANFINHNFFNCINNSTQNILLKKANDLAISRGFNNWQELEKSFIEENDIQIDFTHMTLEEKLNCIAKIVGFNNFDDLYDQSINKNI